MTPEADIITIDVEEWFHGHNYLAQVPPTTWDEIELRVVANTKRCLELLAQHQVRATFFVLGWTAKRFPALVRDLIDAGHEIGCHSYGHPLVFRLSRQEFLDDLDRALDALYSAGAKRVIGFRAPSFSLTKPVHEFWSLLKERGLRYDCSLFPILHPRYGQPIAPRHPFILETAGDDPFVVVPMTTVRILGLNIPFSGGGYLRLLPDLMYRWCRRGARRQRVPVIVYAHPWELDDFQPDVGQSALLRWRSQSGQQTMPQKLHKVLARGRFQTLAEYVEQRVTAGDLPIRRLPLY